MANRKQVKKTGKTVLEKRREKQAKRTEQRVVERKRAVAGSRSAS